MTASADATLSPMPSRSPHPDPLLVGAHVPNGDPGTEAERRGANCVQVFLSNPRGWRPPRVRADADDLRASGLPLWAHAPYLVNLASADAAVRERSAESLAATCAAAEAIGARGVVVHGGSVGAGGELAAGRARWRAALERLESPVPVLIENTAGGDGSLARDVEGMARLWEALDGVEQALGWCFDTCHAHAAGEELGDVIERLVAEVGAIDLIHANDSKDPFGSRRDRHERLGEGMIGPDVLADLLRAGAAPVICETPGDADDHATDVAWARAALAVTTTR